MKKKKFQSLKFKKKRNLSNRSFYGIYRRQFNDKFKPINLISFVKKFRFFNLKAGYSMSVLLGLKPNMKLNFLSIENRCGRIIKKMMWSKFYFNYSFVKEQKFKILKTLTTFKTIRYYFSFPMRGQRTKTNAKTRKKYSIL